MFKFFFQECLKERLFKNISKRGKNAAQEFKV